MRRLNTMHALNNEQIRFTLELELKCAQSLHTKIISSKTFFFQSVLRHVNSLFLPMCANWNDFISHQGLRLLWVNKWRASRRCERERCEICWSFVHFFSPWFILEIIQWLKPVARLILKVAPKFRWDDPINLSSFRFVCAKSLHFFSLVFVYLYVVLFQTW